LTNYCTKVKQLVGHLHYNDKSQHNHSIKHNQRRANESEMAPFSFPHQHSAYQPTSPWLIQDQFSIIYIYGTSSNYEHHQV